MIDTKKTYDRLVAGFTQDQATLLTDVLKEQDVEKVDVRLTKVESKLDMLLYGLPPLIVVCTAILGWLITSQHPR